MILTEVMYNNVHEDVSFIWCYLCYVQLLNDIIFIAIYSTIYGQHIPNALIEFLLFCQQLFHISVTQRQCNIFMVFIQYHVYNMVTSYKWIEHWLFGWACVYNQCAPTLNGHRVLQTFCKLDMSCAVRWYLYWWITGIHS